MQGYINIQMRAFFYSIKTYIQTIYRLLKYKKGIFIHVKENETFGLTYFNLSEEKTRKILCSSFEYFVYKQLTQMEIDEMTK